MKSSYPTVVVKRGSAGLGLFAGEDIPRGAKVIEYTGEQLSHDEANRRGGQYLFILNKKTVLDGKKREHTARYINHSCKPNCYPMTDEDEQHVYIYTRRAIKQGEELTYNYGKDFYTQIIKSKGCRCSACTVSLA